MMSQSLSDLLEIAKQAATKAGIEVLAIYDKGDFQEYQKEDESPVTSADYCANEIIMEMLARLTPNIPIMSEESPIPALKDRANWTRYWLIDPIDGTQEFIARSGDFAINIALIEDHQPVIGVIYWPCGESLYFASKESGAYKRCSRETKPISVRRFSVPSEDVIMIAISRRQSREKIFERLSDKRSYQTLPAGSCSLKACFIAEGAADVFLRLGATGEWDTGASQCIINEAGGAIMAATFDPITYNQRESVTNPDFVVLGDKRVAWNSVIQYR
ncbi:3'(2'), 5'-bisphosphate nucleotidase [Glaciecola punicea ACAM 611]|jgi:3'(2'), 5'-bisphosphate nucleotidase|uniref:3'(2'),5'-bisphosphate nucleotidase CysQ n=1 Tax=Glaciecola punicea ACAM 611 TaxID=1121923 RepID=H5TAR5_9ALTE|nr:3'(2'),5'-bisphosphate nucleotidase CysQ [Glaciecola punicea]OFA31857.1 3'(2'),5'-bisphosphate nucleotidase [Glaciecola punicea]GAB55392.1 3'(2'), 5'-bisphosphate nucleotidase [Glaciecola punicea ACAM 611]